MKSKQQKNAAIERAVLIAKRIAAKDDLRIREQLENFGGAADYTDRESLGIEEHAWECVCKTGIQPRMIFAHPDILKAIPQASLHYRGIALLSRKRVSNMVGSVDKWEASGDKARVTKRKALDVSRLYNAVICSIVTGATEWTVENGYRNILATIGITEDGSMRNIIGQEAENNIRAAMVEWVRKHNLAEGDESQDETGEWRLKGEVCMRFGSEPDIGFSKNNVLSVLIEIKGGKDPAGALERLGAIQKTFNEAPPGCKNFLIAGVVTKTMQERLQQIRMEKHFDIDALLHDKRKWTEFMNEIFHYTLRIAPEVDEAD